MLDRIAGQNGKSVAAPGTEISHGLANRLHSLPKLGIGNLLPRAVAAALGKKYALRRPRRPLRNQIQDRPLRGFQLDRRAQDERPIMALLDPDLSWRELGTFDKQRRRLMTSHAADAPVRRLMLRVACRRGCAPPGSRTAKASMRRVEEFRRYLPDP
jgi:hypothetical protein